ncbi:hypothetical protein WP50_01110, partial [Lactiplantibacillus plantarum]
MNVEIKQPQTQADQASTSSASSSAATDTNSSTASSSRQATSSAASLDSSRSAATTLSSQAVNQTSASSSEPSQETAANQSSSVTESAGETTDSSASISSSSTASQVFSSAPTKQATASAKSSPEEFKQIKRVFDDSQYTTGDNGAFTITAKHLTVSYNPDKRRITVQWSDEYPQTKVPIRLTAVKAEKLALVAVADDQKGPALNVEIKQPQTQADQASTS